MKPNILLLQEVDVNSKRSCYIDQLQWLPDHTCFNYAVCGSQWKAQFIPSDGLGRMDEGNAIYDIKHQHITQFKDEMDRINKNGGWFVAGGDLNTLPPGTDTTDFCMQDKCSQESFHGSGDDPMHKEGCNYEPEKHFLDTLYATYRCAVPDDLYKDNFFLMPQVKIKIGWSEYFGFRLATEHGIFYPTQLMRLVARKGTGGLH